MTQCHHTQFSTQHIEMGDLLVSLLDPRDVQVSVEDKKLQGPIGYFSIVARMLNEGTKRKSRSVKLFSVTSRDWLFTRNTRSNVFLVLGS